MPAWAAAPGECVVRQLLDDAGAVTGLEVLRAAPVVLISPELLDQLVDPPSPGWGAFASFDGDVLRIRAVNRTVVYRVIGWHPAGERPPGPGVEVPSLTGYWPD